MMSLTCLVPQLQLWKQLGWPGIDFSLLVASPARKLTLSTWAWREAAQLRLHSVGQKKSPVSPDAREAGSTTRGGRGRGVYTCLIRPIFLSYSVLQPIYDLEGI